jgi:hypothetical protein
MKINNWIIFGVFAFIATASASLGAEPTPSIQQNFTKLEAAIQSAKDQVNESGNHQNFHWPELQSFQTLLWRAMALDPSIVAPVPVAQVPKNLFAVELNAELDRRFADLKKSTLPHEFKADVEFAQYVTVIERILGQRHMRQFPQARGTAKRGGLDSVYQPLAQKFVSTAEAISIPALAQIETQTSALQEQLDDTPSQKDAAKKEVFANGNRFIWYIVTAIFGFFLGLAGYRLNPDFFQKFLDQFDSTAPTATTHSAGAKQLDYARWLRELEEILSRLKSSQMTLERRIEDIVQNSEKISQQSLSLYADPRIKNEANLEYRVSSLVREVQHQFDQSQRLQAGDRVQINVMLEHCLRLCDAIESNAVHYDRSKSPDQYVDTRSAS